MIDIILNFYITVLRYLIMYLLKAISFEPAQVNKPPLHAQQALLAV